MKKSLIPYLLLLFLVGCSAEKQPKHLFSFGKNDFLLDGKPLQIISGEMHPARIPEAYWKQRIQMAKAMGCNTIAAYIFWNYHETAPGVYDFTTGNHNIARFIRLVQDEGMWLLLRPGPYVCAEWDFGGIPPYLLSTPDIKVRCMDPRYMQAAEKYLDALADQVRPLFCTNGGPIIIVQIENEYGSYGNDRVYLEMLRKIWIKNGCTVPFYTGDGPTPYMLEAGSLEGCAIGMDSGSSPEDFEQARQFNPNVPAFSSETYPGWLTHWGESWARVDTTSLLKEVKFLMDNKKSFNFYVIHGGTNFGFTAGANSGSKGYEPDITSYDYDAPITEQGSATPKYYTLRSLMQKYLGKLAPVPDPVPSMNIAEITMQAFASIWNNLPVPIQSVQPKPMEMYDQYEGLILYKTRLIGHKSGNLLISEPHDYALVFLDGKYIGTINRMKGENSIYLPQTDSKDPELAILVEAMGRINFAQHMIDRKGITDRVTLNGMTLMNWQVYNLPLNQYYLRELRPLASDTAKHALFFRGNFVLDSIADTYFDMHSYSKGIVWVNGHNLGRYWHIGPQQRLYCPAPYLVKGDNVILVFDLHLTQAFPIKGYSTPNSQ
jgi:beta-galactosidase